MIPIKTILHPTDFSKPSEHALRFACALARDYNARLILLHVVEPPVYYGELGMAVPLPPGFHENLHHRLGQMAAIEREISVETMLVEGRAAEQILKVAELRQCDLIVLGTHGRTGLSRVLLGSVAEDVIRHARYPVLTLKSPVLLDQSSPGKSQPAAQSAGEPGASSDKSVMVG